MNDRVYVITEHDGRISLFGPALGFRNKDRADRCVAALNRNRSADRHMQVAQLTISDEHEKTFAKVLTGAE